MDGAREVTQAGILPGDSFTYRFEAYPPGTHYYHSHMDAVQGARGIRGPLIIQRNDDPVKEEFKYDEDLVVFMSDEWRDPAKCLKLEGAMPGKMSARTFATEASTVSLEMAAKPTLIQRSQLR